MIRILLILSLFLTASCTRPNRARVSTGYSDSRANRDPSSNRDNRTSRNISGKTVVQMKKENGVYLVPIKINGIDMSFIFDTGASDICMSLVEAEFLKKQGKLLAEDFVGTARYRIADGSISVGDVINLRSVVIGNKTLHDVKASIVQTQNAPLLLGQSALSRFGNISIDYKQNTITFDN